MPTRKTRKTTTRRTATSRRTAARKTRAHRATPKKKGIPAAAQKMTNVARTTTRVARDTTMDTAGWIAEHTLRTANDVLDGLEMGASYTYRTLQDLSGGKSSKWLKNWQGWATNFIPRDLVNMAKSNKHTWERDISKFANNVARTVKHTANNWIPSGEELMRDAKRNVCDMYRMVSESPVMNVFRGVANNGKEEILSFLNIPSQEEVEQLQRKLSTLEQRMTTVMLRGARNR